MRVAVYPGSFDPWHKGHEDVLLKALQVFDQVTVALGSNPSKVAMSDGVLDSLRRDAFAAKMKGLARRLNLPGERFGYLLFDNLLTKLVEERGFSAVIRGLRNGHDLQYEMNQQYWYEDLGLQVPVVYFICDRRLSHVSGSALRALEDYRRVIG